MSTSHRPDFEDSPLDPQAMLALADDQTRFVTSRMASVVPIILLSWGLAWLIGFLSLWSIDATATPLSLPLPVAIAVFITLMVLAIAISALLGIRSGRGLRGTPAAAFAGTVYGCAWTIGSIAITVFGQSLSANGMTAELANFFYPVSFVIFAGMMYVLGAALWHAVPMLILGIWLVAVGAVAPFFGYPGHYLWMALAGGGGLLALAVASFVFVRVMRARITAVVGRG